MAKCKKRLYKTFSVDKDKVRDILSDVKRQGRSNLLEDEGYGVLKATVFLFLKVYL